MTLEPKCRKRSLDARELIDGCVAGTRVMQTLDSEDSDSVSFEQLCWEMKKLVRDASSRNLFPTHYLRLPIVRTCRTKQIILSVILFLKLFEATYVLCIHFCLI